MYYRLRRLLFFGIIRNLFSGRAYRLNQQVLKIAVSLNIVLSVLIFLCHRPLMHLFTQSEEIIGMTGVIFFIDIFVEIGRAFNHVEDNSLRGAGDKNCDLGIRI